MADVVLFDIIDAQVTACGFLGGMVHAFNDEKATPWQIVKSILTGGIVWAQAHQEGGNLRHFLPAPRVLCLEYPLLTLPDAAERRPRLLLWDASYADGVSPFLRRWAKHRGIAIPRDRSLVRYVNAPSPETSTARFGYLLLPE